MENNEIVKFEGASIFQKDHLVLSNVNFSVKQNEFVYLIGKVGSGKTSLIKTMNAEIPLKVGTGIVSDFNLSKIKRYQVPYLRRRLGIVFQDFHLLTDRTVFENLLFVLRATGWKNKKETELRMEQVLNMVNLTQKGYKMPHQLSGGEQQRIVIARALLNNPEIILADEPTGNIDPETSENIIKLLIKLSENNRTVIMATHNYSLLKKYPMRTLRCENETLTEVEQSQEIDFKSLMDV